MQILPAHCLYVLYFYNVLAQVTSPVQHFVNIQVASLISTDRPTVFQFLSKMNDIDWIAIL